MLKESRILITGGNGVLGRYIVEKLLLEGYSNIEVFSRSGAESKIGFSNPECVHQTKGDIREIYPLASAIQKAQYIIHAAAMVSYDPADNEKMFQINVEGTANVCNLALEANIEKLVYVSSISVFNPPSKKEVIREDSILSSDPHSTYYGTTKYLAEQEVWRSYYEGLNVAIVNPSVILGEGNYDDSSLQLFKRVHNGLPYYPKGGTSIVDAVDVAESIYTLLTNDIAGERFILTAKNIKYKELFELMAAGMDVKPPQKEIAPWMLGGLWRLEWLRSKLLNRSPIITKETVKSTSEMSQYSNQKSKDVLGASYKDYQDTIQQYAQLFKKSVKD